MLPDDIKKRAESAICRLKRSRRSNRCCSMSTWRPPSAWPPSSRSVSCRRSISSTRARLFRSRATEPEGPVPRTYWPFSAVGTEPAIPRPRPRLFPGATPSTTPKPERLLQRVIHLATDSGDIVLDCYGGSGTTAAVAHKMGRRWVTSQNYCHDDGDLPQASSDEVA